MRKLLYSDNSIELYGKTQNPLSIPYRDFLLFNDSIELGAKIPRLFDAIQHAKTGVATTVYISVSYPQKGVLVNGNYVYADRDDSGDVIRDEQGNIKFTPKNTNLVNQGFGDKQDIVEKNIARACAALKQMFETDVPNLSIYFYNNGIERLNQNVSYSESYATGFSKGDRGDIKIVNVDFPDYDATNAPEIGDVAALGYGFYKYNSVLGKHTSKSMTVEFDASNDFQDDNSEDITQSYLAVGLHEIGHCFGIHHPKKIEGISGYQSTMSNYYFGGSWLKHWGGTLEKDYYTRLAFAKLYGYSLPIDFLITN